MGLTITTPLLSGRRRRNVSPFVQCTNLSLLADSIVEEDESFNVILGSSDNGVSVDPTPLTVVILNNDCECFEGYSAACTYHMYAVMF